MEIEALQQRLSGYPEIVAAYLFGSAVTCKLNPKIHRDFVARAVIAYLDFKPLHETAMRNYARSLKRRKIQSRLSDRPGDDDLYHKS